MIKFATKQRIRRFGYCLSFVFAAAKIVAPTGVAAGPPDEANMAYAEDKALSKVLEARLALESEHLERILALQNAGNATWRETARQQTLVDTLQAEQTATRQLVRFLETLRDRVEQCCSAKSELQPAESPDDLPAIKLTLPGSPRLVGWLEWDQASVPMRVGYMSALRASSVPPADAQKQIGLAADKVANYQHKVRRLAKITGSEKAANDLAHAELELAVAHAELQLAQVMRQRQRSDFARFERVTARLDEDSNKEDSNQDKDAATTPPIDSALLAASDTVFVTHQSDSALRSATLDTATQEARNSAALRAAEINLRRLKRRADDLDQLNVAGLATRRDVQKAHEEFDSAKGLLDDLRARHSHLIETYESLRKLAEKDDFKPVALHFASTQADASNANRRMHPDLASLPMSCLANAAVVRHVIDLTRQRSHAQAIRGVLIAELTMIESLEAKLAEAERTLAARRSQASNVAMIDDMRDTLADGRHRELENVRLNIELTKARLLATAEHLEVIRLETNRFAHQITQQFNWEDDFASRNGSPHGSLAVGEQFVAMVANSRGAETEHTVHFELGRLQRTPICYLESHDIFLNSKRFARSSAALEVAAAVAIQPIWQRPFRHVDPLALAPWQRQPRSVYDRCYNRLRHRYRNSFSDSPSFASPSLSYADEYDAFGDPRTKRDERFRQFDRRRPVTYLPGTPDRLPGTPRYLPGTPRRYELR